MLLYCRILRDADKADIFRVVTEPPYDGRNARIVSENGDPARPQVMNCVYEHRCVPRTFKQTEFENLISHCCMAFELEFSKSREIVREQGYLDTLMNLNVTDAGRKEQLEILRSELEKAWRETETASPGILGRLPRKKRTMMDSSR